MAAIRRAFLRCTARNGSIRCVKPRGHDGAHVNGDKYWYGL